MTNTWHDTIISSIIQGINQHGTRDIHYNLIDSAEYIQRCLCELPTDDPIRPMIDKWLVLRPNKFNRWHARHGYEQATKKLLDFVAKKTICSTEEPATEEPAQIESKEYERYADKTARHDYVSIHAAESAYNHIKEELRKVVC